MRIGIDARFYGPAGKGLGRYVKELVDNLQEIDRKNQYAVFLRKENYDLFTPRNPNFQKILVEVPWYSIAEQIKLPGIYRRQKLDLLHVPHFDAPIFYRGKFVVTIHDLTKHNWGGSPATTTKPLPIYWFKFAGYKFVTELAVRRSSKVIVPSRYVARAVTNKFGIDSRKITVTYEAGTLAGKGRTEGEQRVENVLARFKITKPYFIYVGNVYPFKNVSRLLDAVKILNRQMGKPVQLVLVGAIDAFWRRLEREVTRKDVLKYVVFTGYVPDVDLVDLYKEAEAHVQPSLSEGFGLTSVEAMSLGTPVVQSNATCLPEIGADATLYFDPYDPKDMAQKLAKVLGNNTLRQRLIKAGLARAKKFSWKKMAQETLTVYQGAAQ